MVAGGLLLFRSPPTGAPESGSGAPTNLQFAICKGKAMTVRTRQSYMDLCRSDRPWKGRDMADLVDKIYDVEEKADRASKANTTKLVQAKADGFDVAGEGFLQKREGKWLLSEPDFLTEEEADKIYAKITHNHSNYALRRHAPTHHYGGSDPLEGQSIHGLRVVDRPTFASVTVDPSAAMPARQTGQIFWDPDNHTLSAHLEGSDTTGQFFMEQLIYGQNDSGAAHPNGTVGYIKGSQGQRPTIDTARADDRLKSLAIVFSTEATIGSNNSGYYTSRGFVRDVVTNGMTEGSRLWLQPDGGYGTSKPAPGLNTRNVSLGHVVRSHATTGSIFADITAYPFLDEISGVLISSPTSGQLIRFDGTKWINSSVQSSDMPNHATRHHWDGGDPLTGQLISGLRSSDSPSFAGINISELGAVTGRMASNDFWRIKGLSHGSDSGYLEIATADNGNEQILFRQYGGSDYGFTTITRELTLLGSTGETTLPVKLNSPSVRVTNLSTGFVRSDSVGNLSSSSLTASELPNHASRHHWDGADPLTGQSISGLRTDSSPTFQDLNLTGDVRFGGLIGIGKNGYGGIFLRPSSGIVRFVSGESETYCTNAFSATSARFTNLSTGFVRSNASGQLSSSPLIESDLPNHASRHQYGGVDSLSGQSISGLRTVDSPRFLNLTLDGSLKFTGYEVTSYSGAGFFVETSGGDQLLKMTVADGAIVGYGCHPYSNGLELGKNAYRWRLRADDANHEVETINATEAPAGTNIYQIPSVGNYFRLGHPTSGQNKDYRVPTPSSGIGKELILTCTSDDPNGFVRVYAPSGGSIAYNGSYVTYIAFVWGRKLVLHSDGVRWYV